MKKTFEIAAAVFFAVMILVILLSSCGNDREIINSVEELSGKPIIVGLGTSFESKVLSDERISNCVFMYSDTQADGVSWLLQGKGDAYVVDKPTADTLLGRYPSLSVLDNVNEPEKISFAYMKGSPYGEIINNALRKLKSTGELDSITAKWLSDDDELKTVSQQTWDAKNGIITCALGPVYEPFFYYNSDGQAVGLDIDILLTIAEMTGYRISFIDTSNLSRVFTLLEYGNADIGASGLSNTEGRQNIVDFTDSYYESCAVYLICSDTEEDTDILSNLKSSFYNTFIKDDRWKDWLGGLGNTFRVLTLSLIGGTIVGFILFLSSYQKHGTLFKILQTIAGFLTLTPDSTWIYICFYIIFANTRLPSMPIAGFAISCQWVFQVFDACYSVAQDVPAGQYEAAYSLGYSKPLAFYKIIFPQILPKIVGNLAGPAIGLTKSTSLIGLIAAVDIQKVADIIRASSNESAMPIFITTVVYITLGYSVSKLIEWISGKLSKNQRTKEEMLAGFKKGVL